MSVVVAAVVEGIPRSPFFSFLSFSLSPCSSDKCPYLWLETGLEQRRDGLELPAGEACAEQRRRFLGGVDDVGRRRVDGVVFVLLLLLLLLHTRRALEWGRSSCVRLLSLSLGKGREKKVEQRGRRNGEARSKRPVTVNGH